MKVTCPHCGSTRLGENSTVQRRMEVTEWVLENGEPRSDEYGPEEVFWETDEPDGTFDCFGCGTEGIKRAELVIA
jgi:predicted RNA-binding Zn-ribbon protein involved in translation (DUF1610 family)